MYIHIFTHSNGPEGRHHICTYMYTYVQTHTFTGGPEGCYCLHVNGSTDEQRWCEIESTQQNARECKRQNAEWRGWRPASSMRPLRERPGAGLSFEAEHRAAVDRQWLVLDPKPRFLLQGQELTPLCVSLGCLLELFPLRCPDVMMAR